MTTKAKLVTRLFYSRKSFCDKVFISKTQVDLRGMTFWYLHLEPYIRLARIASPTRNRLVLAQFHLRKRHAQSHTKMVRAFVQAEYAEKTLPKPVVFKIDTLRVQGAFAYLECLPQFSDGTDAVLTGRAGCPQPAASGRKPQPQLPPP